MSDKPHAKAVDLPNYPCPPNIASIATHTASWGWANPTDLIAQDTAGYLWVRADRTLTPTAETPSLYVLATWTDTGIGLYVPPRSYAHIIHVPTPSEPEWVPVATILTEAPAYAINFGTD